MITLKKVALWVRRNWIMIGVFGIMVVLVLLPIGMLVLTSFIDVPPRPGSDLGNFTFDNFSNLAGPGAREAARNTLVIAVFGTALALFIGGTIAWLAARTDVPFRGLARLAGIVPLFTSALVGTLAWSLIGSKNAGYINAFFREVGLDWTVNVSSMAGIVFVMGLSYAPYAFLFINSALTLMNPELEDAGAVHGGSLRRVVTKITLPLVLPAIAGAGLLTFVLVSENFPVVEILGVPGRIQTLPSRMWTLMGATPLRHNEAAATGIAMMLVLSALVFIQRRLIRRRSYVTVTGKGFRPRDIPLGRWRWPAFAFVALYMTLAIVFPYFALLQSALRQHQFLSSFSDLFDISQLSGQNFSETMQYEPFRQGLRNSFTVSAMTAVVGGALHFLVAYLVHRTKLFGRGALEYTANLPIAIPALVLGMAFLWTWIRLPISLYGTTLILAMAFTTRLFPQGFQGVSSTILQIDSDLEDAAIVSGASRFRAVRSVTFPLIKTGVASTMLLLFILSFRELSSAVFLYTSNTRLVSLVIFDGWVAGQWPRVASMSLMYSGVLLLVTLFGRRWLRLGANEG